MDGSFKNFLYHLGFFTECAATVDLKSLRKTYKKMMLRCHPDKIGSAGDEITKFLTGEMTRLERYRENLADVPPWSSGTSGSANSGFWSHANDTTSQAAGSGRRGTQPPFAAPKPRPASRNEPGPASETERPGSDCPDAPHCSGFEKKHGKLTAERKVLVTRKMPAGLLLSKTIAR
ncbi:unnamed protein product [Symbiodinium sp. CCMP2592]|nr:unnamed protein product [Symbiodinium sp. CCMP2592]